MLEPARHAATVKTSGAWIVAFAIVAAGTLLVVVGHAHNRLLGDDFWEHAAVVRALAADPLHPKHPLLDVHAPHAFFSPYALAWALVARITGADVLSVLLAASAFNVLLLCAALVAFLHRASSHPWITAALTLPLWLFAWGPRPWDWSGFLNVETLVLVGPYPSTFAAALVFVALAVALDAHAKRSRLAVLAVLTAVCWLVHPTTAVVLLAGVVALFAARAGGGFRPIALEGALIAGAVAAGLRAAAAWPYFPFGDLFRSRTNAEFDEQSRVLFQHVASRMWPTIALAPLLLVRLRHDRRDLFVALAVAAVAIYTLGAFGRTGLGRAVSWIAVFVQLGAAETGAALAVRLPPRAQAAAAALVVIAAVVASGFHRESLGKAWPREDTHVASEIARGVVGADDVVLAELETGVMIPWVAGKIVASPHPLYWVPDHGERRRDVARFFATDATVDERRAILQRWHVRWLFVDRRQANDIEALSATVRADGKWRLLRVDPTVVP